MNKLKVCYVWDEELIRQCNRLPAVIDRASMVHNLISAYGLLHHVQVVRSATATYGDLKRFHSELYLDHLRKLTHIDDEYMPDSLDEEYGIVYDCPPVSDMYKLVSTIAGGSITAAKCLMLGIADVAVNWCGGWHHAQRLGAEGFCYINDIVLAIEKLRQKFPKILYIDLDIHHGNGVQDAYNLSKSVFTLSFHKHEPGFYPGTGSIDDTGNLTGKGFSCNFPFKSGYTDSTLKYVFDKVFSQVYLKIMPDAIVVQCGADALAHDPHGGASLTELGYCNCVNSILQKTKPTILLGGGGYKHENAARLWTALLALVTGVELNENIPEHDQWPAYGPDYLLNVEPSLVKDPNTKEYLDECIATIELNLNSIEEPAPKKQKNDVAIYIMPKTDHQMTIPTSGESGDNQNTEHAVGEKINTKKEKHKIFKCKYANCNTVSKTVDSKDIYEFID